MQRPVVIFLHLAAVTAGTWIAFHPTLLTGFARLQTDPGDTLLNHYILEHSWHWLTRQPGSESLWSPPCFYPATGTLAYSENLLGAAPVYWLWRLACGELLAFQLWMIAVAGLTYASTAWVLRRFGAGHLLAALAALTFAYGLPRVNQLGHQQLLPSMFSPPAVYLAWRFLESPSAWRLGWLAAFAFLQLLASVYLGWFLVFGLSVFAGVRLTSDAATRARLSAWAAGAKRGLVVISVLALTAGAALFAPYISANRGFHRSYRGEVKLMIPRPASWVSPAPASLWARWLPPVDGPLSHEHHLFPGAVFGMLVAAATVVAVVRPQALPPAARVALVTAAVLVGVSLCVDGWSAWRGVYAVVPGAKAVRAVTRIFTAVYLFGWIAAALAAEAMTHRWGKWRHAFAGAILLAGAAEQWQPRLPSFDPRPFFAETDRLAAAFNGQCAVYVEPHPEVQFWVSHLAAQWAGLKVGVPVVNGYSGRTPPGYPDEKLIWGGDELARWLGERSVLLVPAPRLARAFPAPVIPPGAPPAVAALDYRPTRPGLRAERRSECQTSPSKPSVPPGSAPRER
jgi:hypothetical protein